jgi:dinuclear metal center YbgI/SA1388 family protein
MATVQEFCDYLEQFAPSRLAEEWDNVGLLVGDPAREVQRVMTCLTVTPASAEEAIQESADLIVTHHPLPFRPLKRITTQDVPGRLLWQLIGAGISIHSPHTCFDSAALGINQRLAEGLGLREIQPLVPHADDRDGLGAGRWGRWLPPQSLADAVQRVKEFLAVPTLQVVGSHNKRVERVAVACGSAGSFLEPARRLGCQLLVTGETSFHTCLEANANGVGLLLTGHFASERFAVEALAQVLAKRFPDVSVWASRREADPLQWM